MKAEGIDVISFSVGEPDFNTPLEIRQAAVEALDKGFTKYTPSSGLPDLKAAICAKLIEENKVQATPANIVVSCGAKHSVFNALWTTVSPGDEVILFAPYWMTYLDQVNLCGGVAKVVKSTSAEGFVPSIDAIAAAITPKTKVILLNSPSNPTGAVFPPELITQIAELAVKHNLWLISDEIYERLIYGDAVHLSPASIDSSVSERTITINGCSKTFAMTGWRLGYLSAPVEIVKAISNFQDQVTSNPTSFVQKGAIAALKMAPTEVEKMRAEFDIRRKLAFSLLKEIPKLKVVEPLGAFYFYVDASEYLGGKVENDVALCDLLLNEGHVALVPGSVFEGPGCVRMSYAASQADIQRGVARIAEVLAKI